jgi:hypothetical protein
MNKGDKLMLIVIQTLMGFVAIAVVGIVVIGLIAYMDIAGSLGLLLIPVAGLAYVIGKSVLPDR